MSLILEALKKSEDKRRLGAAPDLATPFSAPRRRNWVWPIAAVLVAVGLIAWALRPSSPPPPAPAVVAAPSKNGATNLRAVSTPGQTGGAPLRSVTGANDQTPAPPPGNLPKPAPPPGPPPGKFAVGQSDPNAPATATPENRRAMFEAARERRRAAQGADRPGSEGSPPSVGAGARMPPPPPPQRANALAARTAPPSAPVAASPVLPPAAPVTPPSSNIAPPQANVASPKADARATTNAAASRATKSSSTVGLTAPPPTENATTPASSAQPYSELPFSVRKSLPELKLSMHVYAADVPHRFVVLNDSRLTEGEKTTDEIFVREIRPDGVVLEFQNQRFFYPRDGL